MLALALMVCFFRLGAAPVFIINEAREGVYARAMLASGNYVLPVVPNHVENGELIPDKPPLEHWLACGARYVQALVAGDELADRKALAAGFDEWDLRFPAALAGVITIAGIVLLGPGLIGTRAALLAALALLTTSQFVYQTHFGRVDMILTAWVTLTMLWLGRALLEGSRRALIVAAVFAGLGVLSKGPLGLALPLAGVAFFVVGRVAAGHSPRPLLALPWLSAALVWALVALAWYWAAWQVGGMAFFRSQILNENVAQFSGGNGSMPFYAYVGPWLVDSFPWNLIAAWGAWRAYKTRDPAARFCAAWWLAILIVFQIASYKRRAYLLPALPAGALLAGWTLDGVLARTAELARETRARPRITAFMRACVLLGVGGALAGALLSYTRCALHISGTTLGPLESALGVAGVALLCASVFVGERARRRGFGREALVALFVACGAVSNMIVPARSIARARDAAVPALVARIEAELPPDAPLTVLGAGDDPTMLLLFYAHEPERWTVVPQAAPRPTVFDRGWYLFAAQDAALVNQRARASGQRWREVLRGELKDRDNPLDLVLMERES